MMNAQRSSQAQVARILCGWNRTASASSGYSRLLNGHDRLLSVLSLPARRIHSRYTRRPKDLPWCGLLVQFHLTVPRFFCDNDQCEHRTFVQRLPELVSVHAQKTARLRETMTLLALGMGGELGGRILERIGIQTSPDTLLCFIRQCSLPEYAN